LTRSQKAVKRVRETKGKKDKLRHPCESIDIKDLRVGDEIGTFFAYDDVTGEKFITKSTKVEQIDECPSQWRTHVHVNKQACYDTRHSVTVKIKK
jgi:hypothetical protein